MKKLEVAGEVVKRHGSAIRFCRRLRWQPSRFSMIINDHVAPTDAELRILRRELGDDVVDRAFRNDVEETQPAA
jgi:hypothetical protein